MLERLSVDWLAFLRALRTMSSSGVLVPHRPRTSCFVPAGTSQLIDAVFDSAFAFVLVLLLFACTRRRYTAYMKRID